MNQYTDKDTLFMQRAIELASCGRGTTSPNPMVGCVIVHNDLIVGEGWTQPYGGNHAEVQAIGQAINTSILSKSTAYVTLEPCAHYGKTPPCTDLLIKHKLKKVIIASTDPNPLVNGKGIDRLRDAGIEVRVGLLENEAIYINKRFFTNHIKKRPYIILKWAETQDGFMARENFDSKWISNMYSRKTVHQWRAEEDAIVVGTNTALYDNPKLNVRDWVGTDPVRIVIDKYLKLPKSLHLFQGEQPTLCYNLLKSEQSGNLIFVKIKEKSFLKNLLSDIYKRNIQSVIVEGGSQLLQSFVELSLWDEARIFVGETHFGKGIKAPTICGQKTSTSTFAGDRLTIVERHL